MNGQEPQPGPTCPSSGGVDCVLEIYKLFVDTAEKTSDRRMQANRFYVTLLSSAIAAAIPLSNYVNLQLRTHLVLLAAACALGIAVCAAWVAHINYFRDLNSAKFKVIHEIEDHLPAQCFKKEWDIYKGGNRAWLTATRIDRVLPFLFMVPFGGGLALCAWRLFS